MKVINGVKFATTNSGIKYKNRDDLMLAIFDDNTNVAGVFTKSNIVSPTIDFCRNSLKSKQAKSLIVNSGNANTFNGVEGNEIVLETAKEIAKNFSCEQNNIFISSTGVIGELFDYRLITEKISDLKVNLENNEENFIKSSKAIMTTDLINKIAYEEVKINDEIISIQGFCKGSGMIAPNMATMLAYIFTDAKIDSDLLQEIFSEINEETFNSITVDSDCSTNDTALIFATNKSLNKINKSNESYQIFKSALKNVMLKLAKKIVLDGEGAKKIIEININSAFNKSEAKIAALSIANSPLVKSAVAGCDPNWGRIMMAIGKSQVKINMQKIALKIGEFDIIKNGKKDDNYQENFVHNYMKENNEIKITVDLGNQENNSWTAYGCDLNEEYVSINKDYRS